MALSKRLAEQLGNPSGVFGAMAGFVWRRRNAALNDTAFKLLSPQSTDRVLEIGFGGGYLLDRMVAIIDDGLVAGVDVSATMVAIAEKRCQESVRAGKLDLKCALAEALPYPDGYFSKVCSVNSIFYWQDLEQGLREITRVLMDSGLVVLCYTSAASLKEKRFARHIRLVATEPLAEMMRANGLRDLAATSYTDKHRIFCCLTATK